MLRRGRRKARRCRVIARRIRGRVDVGALLLPSMLLRLGRSGGGALLLLSSGQCVSA